MPRQSTARVVTLASLVCLASAGCASPPHPRAPEAPAAEAPSPLGPSYVLIPLPTQETSLLGRILPEPPTPGRSLEETSRANPCAGKLSEPSRSPLSDHFEDSQELGVQAAARAMLGAYGFEADIKEASHFVYKIETSERVARTDTTEYEACCKEKGCGYGYISALIQGQGEYLTGKETEGNASAGVVVASAGGGVRLRVLHRRQVRGYLAAVVTITDRSKGEALGPLGVAREAGITETTVPELVKAIYEREQIEVTPRQNGYVFAIKTGGALTENAFVRRYREITGSNELDDYDRTKQRGSWIGASVGIGVSAAVAGAGIYGLATCEKKDAGDDKQIACKSSTTDVASLLGTIFGTIGVISSGSAMLWMSTQDDGDATDHFLTERQARLYVEKYNRTLLRKTIRDAQGTQSKLPPRRPSPSRAAAAPGWGLTIGPGQVGLKLGF